MKLQQLRFLVAVVQNELNLTTAAAKLGATQPAVSKQLKLFEEELGFSLFVRSGRAFTRLTPPGEKVLNYAIRLLQEANNIKGLSADLRDARQGVLSIGTTHTQARYVLPGVIQRFRASYPDVQLHLHQGTSEQIAEMGHMDRIDFAIATGARELFGGYLMLPCYQWHRCVIVPQRHPLTRITRLTWAHLAAHPLVTYVFSFTGPSSLPEAFAKAGVTPNVAITARDADVIKTYVRLGIGVGIVADVALDPQLDRDLVAIDAQHLLSPHTTWVGFQRGTLLRRYMLDFLQLLAPHLTRHTIARVLELPTQAEVDMFFSAVDLPVWSRIAPVTLDKRAS
jgi:LysR family transcriptional regulator, cys regulon transcriptional activator